ncbi:MAG TPA: PIN domain-containing protein [Bryobacteraceae bacterium]|nr:PIN domain-containing protein [Bryobacteraceae bacterium]
MPGKAFFDANILIYAFAKDDPRAEAALGLLAEGGVVGVQTLNEFVAVGGRKLRMPWSEIIEALAAIRTLCPAPAPITVATHDKALRIVERHGYHIDDALVIAAALEASCRTLYSENMRDGQVIEGMTIRNPFGDR